MLRPLTTALFALVTGGALAPSVGTASQATPTPESGLTPIIWQWTALESADGTSEAPDDPARYTVQFLPNGQYLLRVDCNSGGGEYTQDGSSLQIQAGFVSLMACPEGSLDHVFLPPLSEVVSFAYEEEELVLTLANDAGVLRIRPSLTDVVWQEQGFQGGDGSEVVPDDPARYTVEFLEDGSVAAQVDCNSGRGTYTVDDPQFDISPLATTRMACPPDSLDAEFARYLDEAVSHVFREGRLYLSLPVDSGIAEFAPAVAEEDTGTPTAGTPVAG